MGRRKSNEAALLVNGLICFASEGKDFNDETIVGVEECAPKPVEQKEIVYKDYSHYDNDFSKDDIDDMLACIHADLPYDDWIRVGMAIKAAGGTCGQFDSWSRQSPKYKRNDAANHWPSFKDLKITAGTLVHFAREGGWEPTVRAVKVPHLVTLDIESILDKAKSKMSKIKAPPLNVVQLAGTNRTSGYVIQSE